MLSNLFNRRGVDRSRPDAPTREADPAPGNIYAFRTAPYTTHSPPETGRYAAFKVIGSNEKCVAIAVLDGVWNASPSLAQARQRSILREHSFYHSGRLAAFGVNAAWWAESELEAVVFLGADRISAEERVLAAQITGFAIGSRYSTMWSANASAEGEWRWTHDRQALTEEWEQQNAQQAAARAAQEERYRTRLSKLTWEQLLAETPFERWSASPPFPPMEFTLAARNTIHGACRALSALGPKPRKAAVRSILKTCVEWFNNADDRAGGVIETEEREDICAVLEEIAYAARQKGLVDEIDHWRTW